jgi:hypothetical protein
MRKTIWAIVAVSLVASGIAEAKSPKHRRQRATQSQGQIACTAVGCAPVPRGCRPAEGRTGSGMPTGNDVVVCPPGVAPFR